MRTYTPRRIALMLSLTAVFVVGAAGQEGAEGIATPPEITIQHTQAGPLFCDVKGFTLYVTERDAEPNTSTCFGACAVEWPPVRALGNPKPFGDWTLVPRDDGAPQWAYKGRPLYRYRYEASVGGRGGSRRVEAQGEVWFAAGVSPFPVRGERMSFGRPKPVPPKPPIVLPDVPAGVTGQAVGAAAVFADFKGLTLYTLPSPGTCGDRCLETWVPFQAPMAAVPIGEWTILAARDGALQWVYKGQALYRCRKDENPGETTCEKPENGGGRAVRVPARSAP